jgi:hypothetical protein
MRWACAMQGCLQCISQPRGPLWWLCMPCHRVCCSALVCDWWSAAGTKHACSLEQLFKKLGVGSWHAVLCLQPGCVCACPTSKQHKFTGSQRTRCAYWFVGMWYNLPSILSYPMLCRCILQLVTDPSKSMLRSCNVISARRDSAARPRFVQFTMRCSQK